MWIHVYSLECKGYTEVGSEERPAKVKPSHFPAFTERVIYWAPDALSSQMSWALPHGGYETLGHIDGSVPWPFERRDA